LLDICEKVFSGEPIDLTTGFVNVIWQGDANSYCLRSFVLCQSRAQVLNVTGLKKLPFAMSHTDSVIASARSQTS
jgi:hypothetical protein